MDATEPSSFSVFTRLVCLLRAVAAMLPDGENEEHDIPCCSNSLAEYFKTSKEQELITSNPPVEFGPEI